MNWAQDIFGGWERFVREWCLGTPPSAGELATFQALEALHTHWPDYTNALASQSGRGLLLVSQAIHVGWCLGRCSPLDGFAPVLERLKCGESSAEPELVVAAAFVDLGAKVVLEPTVNGKRPDLAIDTCDGRVYLEVIWPNFSAEIDRANRLALALAEKLVELRSHGRIEVLLHSTINERIADEILVAARTIDPTKGIHQLSDVASIAAEGKPSGPVGSYELIPTKEFRPIDCIGASLLDGANKYDAVVMLRPMDDPRATRLLGEELKHFSASEMNGIVVRTDRAGGLEPWSALANRWFQPSRNTRVGAILLYEQFCGPPPAHVARKWSLLCNPHSARPICPTVMEMMEKLPCQKQFD